MSPTVNRDTYPDTLVNDNNPTRDSLEIVQQSDTNQEGSPVPHLGATKCIDNDTSKERPPSQLESLVQIPRKETISSLYLYALIYIYGTVGFRVRWFPRKALAPPQTLTPAGIFMFLDYRLISQRPILPEYFRPLGLWRTLLFWLPLTVHPVVVASSLCQLMTKLGQL